MSKIKKHQAILFGILLLGFLIRTGYILTLENKVYWVDEFDYMALANHIVAGDGYVMDDGTPTAFRPVGYPLFLAMLRVVGINSLFAIRFVQVLLGVVSIWLIYLLGKLLFNSTVGLVAAGITTIYPYFIFVPGTVLATSWFSFLLIASTLLIFVGSETENIKLILLSGLLFAWAALTRPSGIVLIIAVMLWLGVYTLPDFRRLLKLSIPFALICAVAVAPWFYRNYQEFHIVNLSTNGGRNLWLGNNPKATINTGSNIPRPKQLDAKIAAAKSEAEVNRIYIQEAKKFILQNPGKSVLLFLGKAISFWRWDPSPTTHGYVRQNRFYRWISILSFGPIFSLSLLGFFFASAGTRKKLLLFFFYAVLFTFLHALFIIKVRFRLPLDYFTIVTASFALMRFYELAKKMRRKRLFAGSGHTWHPRLVGKSFSNG
ncbi:MAG: hypothetical protein GWP06_02175 [Actinobacteria bacterium]|nr:hypothetical protein [Actinomycetota bacterium]